MLKRKVLVKGVNNLSNARYCAGMGVNYICFDLDPKNASALPIAKIKEIKNWLVGVNIGLDISAISEGGDLDLSDIEPDFIIINEEQTDLIKADIECFVISQSANKLSGNVILSNIDEGQFKELEDHHFVENNWNEESISQLLESEHSFGIVLYGGEESRPGYSSYGDLMEILELLED